MHGGTYMKKDFKKGFMRQYWRIQQSQTLISTVFWITTLTLLIWPNVSWRFQSNEELLSIPMTYWALSAIATSVLLLVIILGWTYDVALGLWREHLTVVQERNPFTTYKVNAPWGILLAQTNTILRKLSDEDDEDIIRHCDFIDRWLDWNANQEIWARTMSSWKQIMGDEDPYLFHISEETRANLEEAAKNIQDF